MKNNTVLDTTSLVHESWLRLRRLDAADLPGGEGDDVVVFAHHHVGAVLLGATGADDLREALAGGIDKCNVVGEEAETEPGNTVGPVAQIT